MFDDFFDIKNDRRLSALLYRSGLWSWLAYIALGSRLLISYSKYRNEVGILSFTLILAGFFASMVFEYFHDRELYEKKKKWFLIGGALIAVILYFALRSNRILPF